MHSRNVTTTSGSMVAVRRGRGWRACAVGAALIVLLSGMIALPQPAQAEEIAAPGQIAGQGEAPVAVDAPANSAKDKGMTIFWVVLALSLLFVLGSALALNGLGDKRAPPRRRVDEEDAGK